MITVLCVADEDPLLHDIRDLLERSDEFRVDTCGSAEQALDSLHNLVYDIVVSDFTLPGMDGIALLTTLKAQSGDIPFILLVDTGQETTGIEAISRGAAFYLQKNTDSQILASTLTHLIRQTVGYNHIGNDLLVYEGLFNKIANRESLLILILDTALTVRHASINGLTMTGFDPEEFIGKPAEYICHLIFPASGPVILSSVTSALTGKRAQNIEIEEKKSDGTGFIFSFFAEPICSHGTVTGVQVMIHDITPEKKMKKALVESENRYRILFDNAILGIFKSTPSGQYLDINPAFSHIAGYDSPEEMMYEIHEIGSQLYLRPDDRQRIGELLATSGEIRGFETEIFHRSGKTIWISINARSEKDGAGNILWYEGTIEDITLRKLADIELSRKNEELQSALEELTGAEEELQEQLDEVVSARFEIEEREQRFRKLFDENDMGIALHEIICDETGTPVDYRFLDVNPAFEKLTGLPAGSLIGKTACEVLPGIESYWIEMYGHVALTGETTHFENYSRALGRYYEVTAYSIKKGQFATLFQDVTERITFENEIQETNAYLESLISHANVPIVVWDPLLQITRINHSFELLIGRSEQELLSQPISILFPQYHAESSMELFRSTHEGVSLESLKLDLQHRDGSVKTVLWNTATIFTPDGTTPVAVIAQGRDITAEKLLEREKNAATLQIQENIAKLAILNDGIRNPLSIISLMTSTISDPEVAGTVLEQVTRIDEMVSGLDREWIRSVTILDFLRKYENILGSGTSSPCFADSTSGINPSEGECSTVSPPGPVSAEMKTIPRAGTGTLLEESFRSGPDGIVILEAANGGIIEANAAASRILDCSLEDLMESGSSDGKTRPGYIDWKVILDQVRTCGRLEGHQLVIRKKSGEERSFSVSADTVVIDGIEYLISTIRNFTVNGSKDMSDSDNDEKYQALVEYSLEPHLIIDPGGTILYANSTTRHLMAITDEPGVDRVRNVMEFVAPESRDDVIRDFNQVSLGKDGYIARYKIITGEGQERWIESIGRSISNGENSSILLSLRDITDRHIAEIRLREREKTFRTIFENSPYPIAINSYPEYCFIEVNPSFLTASGFSAEEVIGKNPVEIGLISPGEAAKLISRRILYGRIDRAPLVLTVKDGRRVHVQFTTIPVTINEKPVMLTVAAEVTALKRTEEELLRTNEELNAAYGELRASEEKYRHLTEVINDIIYLTDTTGVIIHVSPQVSRYGFTPEEVISHNLAEFIYEDDLPVIYAGMEKTLHARHPLITRFRIRDKAGNVRWLENNGGPVADKNGMVTGISGILRDVTERTRLEEALRKSEEQFRILVQNSLDGIIIIDFSGSLLFANPAAGSIMCVPDPESMIGTVNVLDFVAPESHDDVLHDISQVAMGIDAYLVHYKLITLDKREIWVECIGKNVPFGNTDAMLVSMRDVTERVVVDEAVRESEKKFAKLFQNNPATLTLVSATDGRFVDVNESFQVLSGYTRDEVIGRTAEEIGIFSDQTEVREMLSKIQRGEPLFGMEIHCRIKTGEIRECLFSSGFILMGGKTHILSTIEDITEQKNAERLVRESEKRMRKANRQLSLLTGITRHDILNKTSAINIILELIRVKNPDSDLNEQLSRIAMATEAIQSQIEFTRVYEDLGSQDPVWLAVSPLIDRLEIPGNMTLSANVGDICVFADPMLEKVFQNLLDNSVRHGGGVTEISISAVESDENLTLIWSDNGVGISVDDKEQIFDRGFGKNTGLGLFLAREILSLTDIVIREVGVEGRGARFELNVPGTGFKYRGNVGFYGSTDE